MGNYGVFVCYVKASEYKTQKEKRWIAADTRKLQLSYRKKIVKDIFTGNIVPQMSRREFDKMNKGPYYTWDDISQKFKKTKINKGIKHTKKK